MGQDLSDVLPPLPPPPLPPRVFVASADDQNLVRNQWAGRCVSMSTAITWINAQGPARAERISLVLRVASETDVAPSLHWLQWDDMASLSGRITYLDRSNRIVYQPAQRRRSFQEDVASGMLSIVIPNAGVKMFRGTGDRMERMPDPVLTVYELQKRMRNDFDDEFSGVRGCVFCNSVYNGEEESQICVLCNLSWHGACGETLLGMDSGMDEGLLACLRIAGKGWEDFESLARYVPLRSHFAADLPSKSAFACSLCAALMQTLYERGY